MTATPNLGLEYMESSQAQPEVIYNDAMNKIDAAVAAIGDPSTAEPGTGGGGSPLQVELQGASPGVENVTKIIFDGPAASVAAGANPGEVVVTIDTVSGGGGGGGSPSCARVKLASNQTIANSTDVEIVYDTVLFDTDSYFSSGHFVAPFTGYFHVDASVIWDTNSGGVRILYFIVNGTTATRIAGSLISGATNACQTVSTVLHLTAGDTVAVHVNNTGSSNILGLEELTTFSIHRI